MVDRLLNAYLLDGQGSIATQPVDDAARCDPSPAPHQAATCPLKLPLLFTPVLMVQICNVQSLWYAARNGSLAMARQTRGLPITIKQCLRLHQLVCTSSHGTSHLSQGEQ